MEFEIPVPRPFIVAVQPGNPDIPPVGTVIVKVSEVSERVPVRLPLNATVPSEVVAVTRADTERPDCETVHVIVPDPVESDTEPE